MPHGDFSDYTAFFCAGLGMASMISPDLWFAEFGPVKSMLEAPVDAEGVKGPPSASALMVIRFAGGLLMFMFLCLFAVRWNVVNGKAAALGCIIIAGNTANLGLSMDEYEFVPRPWYGISAMFLAAAAHLAFNANPMLTSAMLLEKERKKAAANKGQ